MSSHKQSGQNTSLQFVRNIFEEGRLTGRKAKPIEVAQRMPRMRDENGGPMFAPKEWLQESQIKSLFAKFSAQVRRGNRDEPTQPEIDEAARDIDADEEVMEILEIRDEIRREPETLTHPIHVRNSSIHCLLICNAIMQKNVTGE